jgi:hypothetical protein
MFEKLRFGKHKEKTPEDGFTERERQVFARLDRYLEGHEFTLFAQTISNLNPHGEKEYVDLHNKYNMYPKVERVLRQILQSNDVTTFESFMYVFPNNLYGIGAHLTGEQQSHLKSMPDEMLNTLSAEMQTAVKKVADERTAREEERKKKSNDDNDDWQSDMTHQMIRNSH